MSQKNTIQIHELKTDSDVFIATAAMCKTHEIRRDDRGFRMGDILILRETVHTGEQMAKGAPLEWTGRVCVRQITHVMRGPIYGLMDGWAILSVKGAIGN